MYSILVDITKCTGCEKCINACVEANKLNKSKSEYDRAISKDGLSDNRLISMIKLDEDSFARKSCMHCLEPSCVSACLVGGITKSKEGPVIYDPDKCIGCRYCMLSCPFHIPRYEWEKTVPFMKKCDMCYSRLNKGLLPACVANCPNHAIEFGQRDELLRKAKHIISQNPNYLNHVWGEKEFGGTSLLYISDVDLAEIGWNDKNTTAIPELTEPLIEKTPYIGLGVGFSLVGLSWIIRRRNEIGKKNNVNKENDHAE
jgi:formate dehydrogenase iron-sulfur subunit